MDMAIACSCSRALFSNNPTAATSTLHYLLQEKERAQEQERLQIYHQQGFSYLQHHRRQQQHQQSRAGAGGDGVSSGESTPVDALATAFGSGRIVRSAAGRKDRHSKVCTARGLRDRRVRLAAHTAIRFYDVQDRLGYDRPSKAVDWLMRNANHVSHHQNHQGMISGAGVPGWPEHGQRMPSWHASESSAGDGRGAGNGDGYMFGVQARQGLDHQSQLFSQGEPLQSSGGWASSARTWLDPLAAIHQPSAMAGQVGFSHLVGAGGGFMGFLAPAAAQRLQGEEEQGSEAMRE
ncbi:hypothetical protein C2845_PM07G23440 [Panicum miliaceum]|uniref:TCP domain-containing protein n=1 Tax=Panicum miliaceum TaxID=4540 RepID=A0A3L6SQJ8_PANMI|nr:hypothetical protein C2845_PM07G23440 [Panicum miliaceum]